MTLEEAKVLAQNGDIEAMLSLGDYYFKQNTGEGISESVVWYEMAANKGVPRGIHLTLLGKKILAFAGFRISSKEGFDLEFLTNDWKEVYSLSIKLLKCLDGKVKGSEYINRDDVINYLEEASYFLALCFYFNNDFVEAINILDKIDSVRSKILCAICLIHIASTESEYEQAYKKLLIIREDNSYELKNKVEEESRLYAIGSIKLSAFYRCGLGYKGATPNIENAISTLNYALQKLHESDSIELIKKELTHYKKKTFGGYKYIE